jgi:hypothetical protein
MATGEILLPIGAAIFPDGSSSNAAPAMQLVKSSAGAPTPYFLQLAFDATTDEMVFWQFVMPANYSSGLTMIVFYKMTSATSGTVRFESFVQAVTPGDSQDVDADAFASSNSNGGTVPGTAGYMTTISITLTNADSVAAGDFVTVRLSRDADASSGGTDSATGDCEVIGVMLQYTTT